ncbi:hypothetical protein EVAR_2492_1 [Eumeta japonica]|uniref:Uncharacterized protein n=1 Tax=Eumeta variegata TaxID=151549 RepID=A0A4C1SNU8_EUMVA|nr:hypothetical protein EVAR_2492_1 [Eumeta japonica]
MTSTGRLGSSKSRRTIRDNHLPPPMPSRILRQVTRVLSAPWEFCFRPVHDFDTNLTSDYNPYPPFSPDLDSSLTPDYSLLWPRGFSE